MVGFLQDIRVLEFSAPSTMLAGRILADLGADVVTLEPVGGAGGRRIGPYVGGIPGIERSLTWAALNYGKRGMTLDHASLDGRMLLSELLPHFDIVIYERGTSALPDDLEIDEALIHVAIRPFSNNGPKSGFRFSDLTLMAASGAPKLAGEPDRSPLLFPVPQAMMEASGEAAVAALVALAARDRDALGQRADVSTRIAAMAGSLGRVIHGFSGQPLPKRSSVPGGGVGGFVSFEPMYECRDGFVLMQILFLGPFLSMAIQVVQWAFDEGGLSPAHRDFRWVLYGMPVAGDGPPLEPMKDLVAAIERICARSTKLEIAQAARKYGFMAAPVMTMRDIADYTQYRERGLFVDLAGPVGDPIAVPARFAQIPDIPIAPARPAPQLSQHSADIFCELAGLTALEVQALFANGII